MKEPERIPLNPNPEYYKQEPKKIPLPPLKKDLYDDFGYVMSIEKQEYNENNSEST
jgi:hypothetical protein